LIIFGGVDSALRGDGVGALGTFASSVPIIRIGPAARARAERPPELRRSR
jgi:hypothetical protein